MTFINTSGTFWTIINQGNNATGSLFITLLLIVFFVMVVCLLLRLPLEFSAIFVMPLLLVCMAYMADFYAIGGVFLIYLGVLLAKNLGFH